MNPPLVSVELHREQDLLVARNHHEKKGIGKVLRLLTIVCVVKYCNAFEIAFCRLQVINGEKRAMEQVRGKNQWMYTFTNAQLQNVKNASDKSNDRIVAENFFAMVFYTTLKIRNHDHNLHVSPQHKFK